MDRSVTAPPMGRDWVADRFRPEPNPLATGEFRTLVNACIHCGLCLPACPTYDIFGTEMDAPRGRIALMRAAAEGRIPLDSPFVRHIELCLACRACETACPSGVRYGKLVERARVAIEQRRRPGWAERLLRRLALWELLPHRNRLRRLARLLWLYQASGLQRLVRALDLLPERLKVMEGLLPPLPARHPAYDRPAPALGERRGRVALFLGCVQDAFLSPVNEATVRVLQRNGYEVHFPPGQTCCGAAHLHVGEEAMARALARRNVDAFLAGEYEAVINNAGGCGAMLKEYGELLADDPAYAEKARRFSAQVQDIHEFLAAHLHEPPQGQVAARVTYVDSCHLRHAQKVVQQPRDLLRRIPGLELVELQAPDRCCGSAGVYNLVHPEEAHQVLEAKVADVRQTGAQVVATSNAGCQLQMGYGVQRFGLPAQVVHVVELLDRAYRSPEARSPSEKQL